MDNVGNNATLVTYTLDSYARIDVFEYAAPVCCLFMYEMERDFSDAKSVIYFSIYIYIYTCFSRGAIRFGIKANGNMWRELNNKFDNILLLPIYLCSRKNCEFYCIAEIGIIYFQHYATVQKISQVATSKVR